MNSYELSRKFFDWSFENPEKISPTHIAMYFFIIEHCNRLGWKEKFGLPTTMVKEAIGIKNYRTYTNALNDLVEWGFIIMIEKSKNQYSSNIIAIANFTKAHTKASAKALDKALQKHDTKHCKSIDSIDKQLNNEPNNNEQENKVINFIHADKKKLTEKLSHFSTPQKNEVIDFFQSYFALCLEKEKPKTKSQQEMIFEMIPEKITFENFKLSLQNAITGAHQTIYWEKEKNFAPKKETERENLKDKVYDESM